VPLFTSGGLSLVILVLVLIDGDVIHYLLDILTLQDLRVRRGWPGGRTIGTIPYPLDGGLSN